MAPNSSAVNINTPIGPDVGGRCLISIPRGWPSEAAMDHFQRTSSRCQRSNVSGPTRKDLPNAGGAG
jgi:hypothetical protein